MTEKKAKTEKKGKTKTASDKKKTVTAKPKKKEPKTSEYAEGIGRRKTATARVRVYISEKTKNFLVNDSSLEDYFPIKKNRDVATAPFEVIGEKHQTTVKVSGGGPTAQAEAVRHGLSRALLKVDESWRKQFKTKGFLTRDSRMKERKKPGLRKARRPQQWRKR